MKGVDNETMRKQGYCAIEKRITSFRRLPNKKWICESSECSMTAGQCSEVPNLPKKIYPNKFQYV